ncbi:RsiV family protein [Planococcus sp. S3-L1]|uniref:RsiV family protein n=1 Tax=Planococcus sp. S3-L1 TaxID=3046200 RepID=UPI0024BB0CBC|nr:RsiV family protein [Planococcus sp. S3-L1]MDJ0332276.1 RsiV family protein [Planococcus sp. S3-L1]
MKKLEKLKKDYDEIEIPSELEGLVKDSIRQAKSAQKKPRRAKKWSLASAAAAALFVGSINVSPAWAQSMSSIPGLGAIVEVFTVQKVAIDEETYQANLTTPAIEGLENNELQNSLNEKYIEENKVLLEQFEQEVAGMKEIGEGHLGIDTGYEVITDTEQLLSIARYEVEIGGSSSMTMKYDTVDKENSVLITLPSLFKDDQYIDVISLYIAAEMKRQMAVDEEISYFTSDDITSEFSTIKPDQKFYITPTNKLVIAFDEYEVAAGYMGVVTFEIPTNIIDDLLVSDKYIK